MNKFFEIPTDHYVPLSHDNNYLFNHYDRITNFLTFNIDQQYRNLLAKPIKNGYQIEWFSAFPNLINAQGSEFEEFAYAEFYKFLDIIQEKIEFLKVKKDKDANNWAEILEKVFNSQDILIYSNGSNIALVWGWKFDNNEIYRPAIQVFQPVVEDQNNLSNNTVEEYPKQEIIEEEPVDDVVEEKPIEEVNEDNEAVEPVSEEELPEGIVDEPIEEEFFEEEEEKLQRKPGFLEFLKWFAAKYWWFLIVLLVLIVLVFLYKSLYYSQNEQVFL